MNTICLALMLAQTAPARDGVISGQVVDASGGKPVSAVVVTLGGTMPGPGGPRVIGDAPRMLTGGDGRFVFQSLANGSYTITAVKGGYAEGASGRRRPGGTSQGVTLTVAQPTRDVQIRIWKYGVITGTVMDEAGEPVVGVAVRALIRRPGATPPFAPAGTSATTDDRGVYRIASLLPGEYIVTSSPPGVSATRNVFTDVARTGRATGELAGVVVGNSMQGIQVGDAVYSVARGGVTPPPPVGTRMRIYPPTFHPSALSVAQASTVTLAAGEEHTSADIQLIPVVTSRVSGTLLGASGPATMVPLRLLPGGIDRISAESIGSIGVTDGSGMFSFPAVVPGQYTLTAEVRDPAGVSWLAMPLAVAGDDVDGVVATLNPSIRVTVRTEFDGITTPPSLTSGRINSLFRLEREDGRAAATSSGAVTAQTITLSGYTPGRYRVRVENSPQGWMFKGAFLNGVDVSITPFDLSRDVSDLVLAFTDRWSGVSGVVSGRGADAATVLAFAADAESWVNAGPNPRRLRSARANAAGQFGISSLPPGDYYVIAIPEDDAADWRDPAVLDGLSRQAMRLSIVEGEHKAIDLQLTEVRR